jgi:hypothetical protein
MIDSVNETPKVRPSSPYLIFVNKYCLPLLVLFVSVFEACSSTVMVFSSN